MNPELQRFIQRLFFMYGFIGIIAFLIVSPLTIGKLTDVQIDETVYNNIVTQWNAHGFTVTDNKPIFFLEIQRLLKANETIVYTRVLNYLIIVAITVMMWRMTRRYEALLFFLIPWFLNSMWLTVEIIEVFFVVLAIQYQKYSGVFVGLAMLFRPYALLYTALLEKKQWWYIGIIGVIFIGVYAYYGMLWDYLRLLVGYGTSSASAIDYVAMIFYGVFFVMGSGNKTMMRYGVVATIPIFIRQFGHYFLPSYSLFFLGYLMTISKNKLENL